MTRMERWIYMDVFNSSVDVYTKLTIMAGGRFEEIGCLCLNEVLESTLINVERIVA